jgi:hypothetical protein
LRAQAYRISVRRLCQIERPCRQRILLRVVAGAADRRLFEFYCKPIAAQRIQDLDGLFYDFGPDPVSG